MQQIIDQLTAQAGAALAAAGDRQSLAAFWQEYLSRNGKVAGLMAASILDGTSDPATTPVSLVSEVTPAYNSEVLATLGLTLPQDYQDAQDVCA